MKTILAKDVKRGRVELPTSVVCLQEIDFISVSKHRRGARLTWRVEFTATQLRRFVRAATEAISLVEANEALSTENSMLQRNNETLLRNLEEDWPARKKNVEFELRRLQEAKGKVAFTPALAGCPASAGGVNRLERGRNRMFIGIGRGRRVAVPKDRANRGFDESLPLLR